MSQTLFRQLPTREACPQVMTERGREAGKRIWQPNQLLGVQRVRHANGVAQRVGNAVIHARKPVVLG